VPIESRTRIVERENCFKVCVAERCWARIARAAGLPFVAERNVGREAAPFEREVHQLDRGVRLRWVNRISERERERERE